MPALVVPTIFTAVDKLSGTIQKMQRSVGGFAGKASIGINALNNGLNKLVPSFGGIIKKYGSMAKDFAFFTLAAFSIKSILDYEQSLAHLHGLLNNLSDTAFKPYQKEVDKVAKATQYSASAVADAFTKISERNIALAKTPESLGAVTEAAITLSRAAKMELVPATEALVNVLFQFGLQGKDSGRVINVLAAGMKYGSSNIENQIEAYKKFAVTARGANITLEQSNALIQTVAHQVQGSDAGTALRNIILNLEKYKNLYKNGKFDIGFALDTVAAHLKKMGTEQKQNIFLQDLFGKRSVNAARQLLENIPLYNQLTQAVTGTNEAQKIAEKNQDNVKDSLTRLVNAYTNYITSNDNTLPGLKKLRDAIKYVTNNIDTILDRILTFAKWFLILKGAIWAVQLAIGAYNIAMGVMGVVTGVANIAIGESSIALAAYKITAALVTGTNYLLGTSIGAVATDFGIAETAAASFFATLGAFVIPAAIASLAGYQLWKAFQENQKMSDATSGKKVFFSNNSGIGKISPFSNSQEESNYQKWFVDQRKAGISPDSLQRTQFDKLHGGDAQYHTYPKLENLTNPSKQNNGIGSGSLDINFHNAPDAMKQPAFSGSKFAIPVKVTSTTGKK